MAQNDIKKVLAYSTVSQLGYMFLAIGSGAFVAAIFHMITHAFFKALLFLGSGSVIHGMHDEQDMRKMGALRKFMPVTAATFIVGWLAISGVPPFAGFWSKDEILLFALVDSPPLYVVGLVTAVLTAFYMTRQVIMVFFGEARWESYANADEAPEGEEELASTAHGEFKPHESPPIMLFPLVVLAGLAPARRRHPVAVVRADPVGRPAPAGGLPASGGRVRRGRDHRDVGLRRQGLLALVAIACAAAGIGAAVAIYAKHGRSRSSPRSWPTVGATTGRSPRSWAARVARRSRRSPGSTRTSSTGRSTAWPQGVSKSAGVIRKSETGNVRNYAAILGLGVVLLLVWFVVGRGML